MTINYQNPWSQMSYGPTPFNPYFPQQPAPFAPFPPQGPGVPPFSTFPPQSPIASPFMETSFIENIIRLNRGKTAMVYMSFEGSQWGSKIFKGEILGAGKDHILLRDNQTNITYLLLTIYLSYVTFDEEVNYEYPFG